MQRLWKKKDLLSICLSACLTRHSSNSTYHKKQRQSNGCVAWWILCQPPSSVCWSLLKLKKKIWYAYQYASSAEKNGFHEVNCRSQHKFLYLLVGRLFWRWPGVANLTLPIAPVVITNLKSMFAHNENLEVFNKTMIHSFPLRAWKNISRSYMYGFRLSRSSPYYPQGNDLVEQTVKTIKNLMRKSEDLYLTLLMNRTTALHGVDYHQTNSWWNNNRRTTYPKLIINWHQSTSLLSKWYG